eukprot:3935375-Rhodomonas_salina.1
MQKIQAAEADDEAALAELQSDGMEWGLKTWLATGLSTPIIQAKCCTAAGPALAEEEDADQEGSKHGDASYVGSVVEEEADDRMSSSSSEYPKCPLTGAN